MWDRNEVIFRQGRFLFPVSIYPFSDIYVISSISDIEHWAESNQVWLFSLRRSWDIWQSTWKRSDGKLGTEQQKQKPGSHSRAVERTLLHQNQNHKHSWFLSRHRKTGCAGTRALLPCWSLEEKTPHCPSSELLCFPAFFSPASQF